MCPSLGCLVIKSTKRCTGEKEGDVYKREKLKMNPKPPSCISHL